MLWVYSEGPEVNALFPKGICWSLSFNFLLLLGVATDAKVGSELIKLVALDADIGNNSLVLYSILGIRYIKQHSNDSDEVANIFSIGKVGNKVLRYQLNSLVYIPVCCMHET